MTLFEVAVSLAILASAITGALLVFPVGIRAQQQARFQLYAGALATQLVDSWTQADHSFWRIQVETEDLAQNAFMSNPIDFERMLDNNAMGMLPLPNALASRLDSDGDEIAKHLDEGGILFYPTPVPAETGFDSAYYNTGLGAVADVPPETQKLVFAVVGYAQQNALPCHPCLAGPYQEFYPAPPQPWEIETWRINNADPALAADWPTAGLVKLREMAAEVSGDTFHLWTDGSDPVGHRAVLDRYLVRARELAAITLPADLTAGLEGPEPALPPPFPAPPWSPTDAAVFPPAAKILALRWLASATLAATSDRVAPAATPLSDAYVRLVVDAADAWADRYAATSRWDFGAPRPLNRQTSGDWPLLQFDLFPGGRRNPFAAVGSPPVPDGVYPPAVAANANDPDAPFRAADGTGDVSWRVIGERQPIAYGRARGEYGWANSFENRAGTIPDNHAKIAASWGVHERFNLTRPFAAAERMRELVCWSVDWRAFSDCEELPPDPCDSTRHFVDSRGVAASNEYKCQPEAALFWTSTPGVRWSSIADHSALTWPDYGDLQNERPWAYNLPAYRAQWLGLYGVDRDGDGQLDHGPLPPSARMRATLVARYLIYDRRIISGLRN